MAKKPKAIVVNKTQTGNYNLEKDDSLYLFGPKFKADSATITTGIDTADTITKTNIGFAGKINLAGVGAVGIDLDVTTSSSITTGKKASIVAAGTGIDAHATGGILTLTNNGTITGTSNYGVSAVNDSAAYGSMNVINNKAIVGGLAGVVLWDDGAAIVNGLNGSITGTSLVTGSLGVGIAIHDRDINDDIYIGQNLVSITNLGKIAGATGSQAILADFPPSPTEGSVNVVLTNSGVITGDITLGQGTDIITNDGTITGQINMGSGNDVVIANKAISGIINLGGGDDRFVGILENGKAVFGGIGNDTFIFKGVVGLVTENAGEGTDSIAADISIDLANMANIENATARGIGDIALTGNSLANGLFGNSGKNIIDGGAGNDTINGGEGNDVIDGGDDDDVIDGGAGDDMIKDGTGNDDITGGVGIDHFIFATGCKTNQIRDFVDGTDKIDLVAHGVTAANFGTEVFITYLPATAQAPAYCLIGFSGAPADHLFFVNVTAGIDASDFILG